MGKCKYCGKDAGLLRGVHKECDQVHLQGWQQIHERVLDTIAKGSAGTIKMGVEDLARRSYISAAELNSICTVAWQSGVEQALADHVLSRQEEDVLVDVKKVLCLDEKQLEANGTLSKLVKAAVIRELLEGKIPQRVKIVGQVPFNLEKNEVIVWLFNGVNYYEEITYTTYQGSNSGFGSRVGKGLYFGTGSFAGNAVTATGMALADNGSLAATDKNVYFAGGRKAFRIPYGEIVAFKPYLDGIGIQRDGQSAKPQIFQMQDGWFVNNLVTNLANIAKT